jgi:hypothetical protein
LLLVEGSECLLGGRPSAQPVRIDAIPGVLKAIARWVVWRYVAEVDETGQVDWDKPPASVSSGGLASSTDPRTWSTFEQAEAAYHGGGLDGLGFVLHAEEGDATAVVAIDLDHCRDAQTGVIEAWALHIIGTINSYTEVSPSGCGVRIFLFGRLPANGRKKGLYENYETSRYVTVTGQHLAGTPLTVEPRQAALETIHRRVWPEHWAGGNGHAPPGVTAGTPTDLDDAELVRRAGEARNGPRFRQLWAGDTTGFTSRSEADLTLCNYLAFWCGGPDQTRIDELFRQSGLFRSKWNREDYRRRTIAKALAGRTEYYQRNGHGQGRYQADPQPEPWQAPIPLSVEPAVAAFPVQVFPERLAAFAEEIGQAMNCPLDYAAVPMLAIAGAAAGASRALEIKRDWWERCCLYAAVIGPPGVAKTPPLKQVAKPVYKEQTRRAKKYREAKDKWDEQDPKERGPRPIRETVYVCDVTTEKLAEILQDNPRGVVVIRDELTGWVASMNQYRANGRGADRQFFLSSWAGEPVCVDRKNRDEPVFVAHPFVAVVGGLPPDLLTRLRGEQDIADGFLDRILFSYPVPPRAVGETWACVSEEATDEWAAVLKHLWSLEQETTTDSGLRPKAVNFTQCGHEAWQAFTEDLAAQMNAENLADAVRGHLAKFKGYGARLALIIHLLRQACHETTVDAVDGESVARAAQLIAYFQTHALKVHSALGSDKRAANSCLLWKWLRNQPGDTFSRRDAYRVMRYRVGNVDNLEPVLELLVKHGYIRPKDAYRPGPGRRSEVYDINPLAMGQKGQKGQNAAAPPPEG